MHKKNIANAGWIIGCKIVQALLGVLISMLTARYLGPSTFGLVNYASAIVAFVAPIASLGLAHVIVQEIVTAPASEGKILGSAMVLSLISSVLCILGVVSFAMVTNPEDGEAVLVCGLYSLLLLSNVLELTQYWFQAKLLSKYTAVVSVAAYVLISAYKAALLLAKKSVCWFAVSNALDHLLIGIALIVIYYRKGNQRLRFSSAWARRLFSKSKYFILSSMMVTIFAQTDKIMLRFMIGDAATGIYSAAISCVGMTSFVYAAIIDSMRPTILESKKQSELLYETNVCRLYSVIFYMALAQSLLMTFFAKPIVWILYGNEYLDAVSVLRIAVWYSSFSYMGSVRNVWILAEQKQRHLWVINLSGAIANVVLNVFMIHLWGSEGAALASVITQFFTNVAIGFIFKPIQDNNALLLRSLNPKILLDLLKTILRS